MQAKLLSVQRNNEAADAHLFVSSLSLVWKEFQFCYYYQHQGTGTVDPGLFTISVINETTRHSLLCKTLPLRQNSCLHQALSCVWIISDGGMIHFLAWSRSQSLSAACFLWFQTWSWKTAELPGQQMKLLNGLKKLQQPAAGFYFIFILLKIFLLPLSSLH